MLHQEEIVEQADSAKFIYKNLEFYLANHSSPMARQNKNKLSLKSCRMCHVKQQIPTTSAYTVTFLVQFQRSD
jgi:hypothetical protein